MGFSISGSTVVIFIGLLVSAATLYPAVDGAQEARADAIDDKSERMLVTTNTAVAITDVDTTGDSVVVAVENTGTTTLEVGAVDLLVDGAYRLPDTTAVGDNAETTTWQPGERLELTISNASNPDRVKVVTGPGVAATAEVA